MNIRSIRPDEFEAARALLSACGWTKKIDDPEVFAASVRASQLALVADDGGQVVGFRRAITDGIFNGYISMVAVAPDRQRSGIGRSLIEAALRTSPTMTWVLRADRPGVQGFYTALGFEASAVAMERRRP